MRPNLTRRMRHFELARESYKFDLLEEPKHASRADLHAFILLNKLCPSTKDIVAAAEHDKYYLEVDLDRLETIASDDDIRTLVRCGINYDEDTDSLYVFT